MPNVTITSLLGLSVEQQTIKMKKYKRIFNYRISDK